MTFVFRSIRGLGLRSDTAYFERCMSLSHIAARGLENITR